MSTIYGLEPRPRVLVVGLAESGSSPGWSSVAPTVRFIDHDAFVSDRVSQLDWELIVLWDCDAEVRTGVCVVQFGGTYTPSNLWNGNRFSWMMTTPRPSATYAAADELVPAVRPLIPSLADQLVESGMSPVMRPAISPEPVGVLSPFLLNSERLPVAGYFRRNGDIIDECWWLPLEAPGPEKWIAAALATWRKTYPERFTPEEANWSAGSEWQSSEERQLTLALADLDALHSDAIRKYEADRNKLVVEMQVASERAEVGPRRLLTAQGEDLKNEVAEALRDLGYLVEDSDIESAKKGDLLEDLRIRDPNDTTWIALAEVRGYTGGAKLSDLQRIARFVSRYAAANSTLPSASWYIVNQFVSNDPAKRPTPLASNPEEVAEFAEGGGLVVDTRDLFQLRERVRAGDLSKDGGRATLKATGRFSPDQDSGPS
ncbi:MAG: hypothetical protein ACRCYU_01015 [Nocardioides sp.]